jgi:signal transduction histidine kinase/ActR/RegA family two-component response regulator
VAEDGTLGEHREADGNALAPRVKTQRQARLRRRLARLLMTQRRFSYYGYSRWIAASVLVLGAGTLISVLGAHALANTDAQRSRLAFERSSATIASAVTLGLEHEQDLELAAGASVADHHHETEAKFATWARAIQADRRYPELAGVGFAEIVPAARLAAFAAAADADPLIPAIHKPFKLMTAGRPDAYCLNEVEFSRNVSLAAPPGLDFCARSSLWASRATGRGSIAVERVGGATILCIANPVYRGGAMPATPTARLHDFLGWTDMEISPKVLLAASLRGEPGVALTLHRSGSSAVLVKSGRPRIGSQSITTNLHDGTTLVTYGVVASAALFSDGASFAILGGGIALTLMLALVVFLLGTGRARALRVVEDTTVQLSEQVVLSSLARDEAVEASNAKSVFVAMVSHELRTPLSGVIGTSELLLDTPLNAEQREYAEIVHGSSEGLLLVINDILDYSKIEADKLELDITSFSLGALIADCAATLRPVALGKGIRLEVGAGSEQLGWLQGDCGRLRQVIINLLSNAVKFTHEGVVTLSATTTPKDGSALMRVEVSDTGIGIEEVAQAQMFEPFTQADSSTARKYGGTGLGLTISSRLVELMGGTIGVTSSPGRGSRFWFEVPLAVAGQGEGRSARQTHFSALGTRDADGNLTEEAPLVLVAEDNAVNQLLATRILDKCGYRSVVVNNGLEAVEAVERGTYAAVLMDCQMPEMDGYEATRLIRSREAGQLHVPIVATTAHSMNGDREKCLAAGMDDYVSKPIRSEELLRVLESVIERGTRRMVA